MALDLITAPSMEALRIEHARKQCEVEGVTDHDTFLDEVLIPAATDRGQLATQRQFITADWALRLDGFPCGDGAIEVPRPPLQAVTSITYVDPAGVTQTLAASAYQVDAPQGPRCARGRIRPAYGYQWPATRDQLNAVTVFFTCGYGDVPEAIPGLLRMALLQVVATFFLHREEVVIDAGVTAAIVLPRGATQIFRSFKSHARTR